MKGRQRWRSVQLLVAECFEHARAAEPLVVLVFA
jgi:hypothetical protein